MRSEASSPTLFHKNREHFLSNISSVNPRAVHTTPNKPVSSLSPDQLPRSSCITTWIERTETPCTVLSMKMARMISTNRIRPNCPSPDQRVMDFLTCNPTQSSKPLSQARLETPPVIHTLEASHCVLDSHICWI